MNNSVNEQYKQMWDQRYSQSDYAYGKEPNVFFKESLQRFKPGSLLMPADGEGRNGVFAAQLRWNVTSFDLSPEAKPKALDLAKERGVTIDFLIGELEQLPFQKQSFNAIGLIYAHVRAEKKASFHKQLEGLLKPGGVIILEAFSKGHMALVHADPRVGGPRDLNMLYSKEEILADFRNCDIILLEEKEIFLNEGIYHIGTGSVVRFIGIKRTS